MVTPTALDWRRIAAVGIVAGVIGGVLFDAFLYVALVLQAHQPPAVIWQSVNAVAVAQGGNLVLAAVIHLCISTAWGIGYAYAAFTRSAIAAHPYISGPVFGFIVMVIMQLVQMAAGAHLAAMTAVIFITLVVAHCVFFGLPIALYVSRMIRA